MTTRPRTTPKPDYGQRLEQRRGKIRKSLDDIANETDGLLYKQFLYRLENGKKKPSTLTVEQIKALATALEWTPVQLADVLEIVLPSTVTAGATFRMSAPNLMAKGEVGVAPNPLENFTMSEKFITYPVYTSASAGTGEPEIIEGEVAAIPEGALRARGVGEHNRHEVMPVKVNGNCLVSQNVRFSDKNVSHGDYVFVHLKAPPNKGDRVCCFDHSDNQLIIKFLGEAQDPNQPDLITFFDARGLQYVRKTSDIEYVGVVFWRSGGL